MPTVLIIGATRGLGAALTEQYAAQKDTTVLATGRSPASLDSAPSKDNIHWITGIDIGAEDAGPKLITALQQEKVSAIDLVIITAGYFGKESFDEPNFADQLQMYRTSAIGPVFLIHHLVKGGLLRQREAGGSGDGKASGPARSKIILVSSESGSITLRHASEGGGNYGHHASKSALNMAGKLLSLDLADKGIAVGMVHPGFMRTEMTKSVGFDKFWDQGGAVTPDVAAASLIDFVTGFNLDRTGEYWAPRGPG
ncbi:MAG: hypothetical protein M4579_003214 [Chaenotheca gracillima]|nr:MAG: hypothetical protein M4579_003214 [Chaenotheca gracillima]